MNVARIRELLERPSAGAAVEPILPGVEQTSDWTITRELARFLALLILDTRPQSVLEFGAGTSSLLLARALELAGGGALTSVEHKPQHVDWAAVEQVDGVDARMVVSPLRPRVGRRGFRWEYVAAHESVAARGPYQLVLIDAPPRRFRRDGSFALAYRSLAPGAVIVLDDAGRKEERRSIRRWAARYAGIRLVVHEAGFGGKGVAVLTYS